MGKLIFAGILLVAGLVGWRVLAKLALGMMTNPRDAASAKMYGLVSKGALALAFVLPTMIVVFSTFVIISTGHVGVVTEFSKVEPTPLYEGFNFVAPWKVVSQMSAQIQKKEGKFDAGSKDLQAVHVKMIINYRLTALAAPVVFQTVGIDYASTIITPAEQEVLKAHTARYPASEILHEREKLKGEIHKDLGVWLTKYGIELKETSLADIDFDKNYRAAIEAKQIEEQKAAQKVYELQQAEKQAQIVAANAKGVADAAREEAKGAADATRTEAQAAADSLRLRGQAQSEYNSKVAASLTQTLLEQQRIAAWQAGGSQVPQFNGIGSGLLMNIPAPSAKGAKQEAEK